jgi:hypothetical protein
MPFRDGSLREAIAEALKSRTAELFPDPLHCKFLRIYNLHEIHVGHKKTGQKE